MKKEFTVERQGKTFVLYAGLLDAAHGKGLKAIRTQLLQVPGPDNDNVAVVQATVELENGSYSGLGDASPLNVAGPMRTCLIRMAETRAKARALRDAVNVSAVALEELADDDEVLPDPRASNGRNRPTPIDRARSPMQAAVGHVQPAGQGGTVPATPAQVKAIYGIARHERQLSENEVDTRCREYFGRPAAELTKRQASEVIELLRASQF